MKSLRHLQIALFFGLGFLLLWQHADAPRLGGAPAQAAARPFVTCTWNTSVGDWADTAKWTNCGGGVPGASDTAVINSGTVTVSTPVTVGSLQLNGGTLTGGGTLTVNNSMTWAGGIMSGAGVTAIAAGGTLELTANSTTLDGRTLNNAGTATLSTPFALTLSNQAVFNNQAGATFNLQSDANILIAGTQPNVFNNFGTVRKMAGIGNSIFTVFNNQNLVEVQAGYISLTGGGACSGPLNVGTGATFVFNSGNYTLNTGAELNGTGTFQLNSATLTMAGDVVCAPAFSHNGGTLNGAGTFTANSSYTWAGGWMSGSGSTTIAAGATLNLPTAAFKALDGRTLNNAGTTNLTGTGGLSLQNQAVFNNQAGALFAVQSDADISGGTFNNSGIWRKTVSGDTQVITVFNNSGSFDLQAGLVTLSGGGASNGVMIVGNGVTLMFGNNYTFNTGAMLNGAGTYHLNSNFTLSVAGNVVCPATFNQSNGTLSGPGTFTASHVYNWSGGKMVGGTTLIPAGATLNLTGSNLKSLEGHTLNNAGTTNLSGTGALFESNQAVFNNQAGALFDVQSDADINLAGNGNFTNTFNNAGIFRKSAVGDTIVGPAFNNSNQVQLLAGSVQFFQFTQIAGSTSLNGGALSFGPTGQLQGGTLSGNGTITGILNHSGGTISPGLSPGTLTINGAYTQGPNATLNIELGGTTAGTQYDRLAVTGAVSLSGALSVTTINSFVPAPGHSFTIATFGSRTGAFSALTLPSVLSPFYSATNIVLGSCPANTITPATLPNGTAGTNYNQALTVTGGAGSSTFSIASGALPTGVTLSSAGLLSGTPAASGQFNFTIRANDTSGCLGERAYTLAINAPCAAITVNPANATLPAGQAGVQYSQTFTQTGGAGAATFAITAGALPNGLSLSPGGALAGAPTAFGDFNFTVTATDANGCTGARAYSLHISAPCQNIIINPATLPDGTAGTAYNQTATASGGTAPYTYTVSAGSLPGGLNLASGGALTGTPNAAGVFTFTVKATDANGCNGARAYTVTINGALITGLQYYPLPRPVRILDTRAGQGNCDNASTPVTGGTSITAPARLICEGISIPANARAITGNLTALNQTNQIGYLTIYPDGQNVPLAANMIYAPNDILSNNFTVGLSAAGNFNVFGERTIHIVVDISGYYAPPAAGGLYYHPLSKPVRLLDTRAGQGNCDNVNAPINAGTSLTKQARITCDDLAIPASAQAIAGNATVINVSGQTGYLTIYPNGVPAPLAGNMVYFPGQLLANAFTVSLSATGEFNIFAERQIDMVIDVAGYYSSEANDANGAGLLFNPLATPVRILDTRAGEGNCDSVNAPISAGTSLTKMARMTCEGQLIPNTAQAVIGNVTVINQTAQAGYLTLYPTGQAAPLAANMIYQPGQILSNAFVVGLSAAGQFNIFAERTLDAVVDVSGFFAP